MALILGTGWLLGAGWSQETSQQSKTNAPQERPQSGTYHRRVSVPGGARMPAVVVCEFFTHGQLDAQGKHIAVLDGKKQPVPSRVLTVGPGNYCRIAFQPHPGETTYQIHYGAEAETGADPAWSAEAGLLVQVWKYRDCNLQSRDALLHAIAQAEPIGRDYVPAVYFRSNPCSNEPGGFFSTFTGKIQIPITGTYKFFTTSQDASFLSIDGKQVVAWPGHHGPVGNARHAGEARLSAGLHDFEYVHAAAGTDACMVAAWQRPGTDKPEPIPPEAFGSHRITRLPAPGPWLKTERPLHDMAVRIAGEVVYEENQPPLLRVQFRSLTGASASTSPRGIWEFGDGQTSSQPQPTHIYLRPGLYKVKYHVRGEPESLAAVNQVAITRALPAEDPDAPGDQLAAYLPVIEGYHLQTLDAGSMLAWIQVQIAAGRVSVGAKALKEWYEAHASPTDDAAVLAMARLVCPILRDEVDRPAEALDLWKLAAASSTGHIRAECQIEAADLVLNDLARMEEAKSLLDLATPALSSTEKHPVVSRLHRVWGDWHAAKGDGQSARDAYQRAQNTHPAQRSVVEREATRGSLSRSTEAFLRDQNAPRAISTLRDWLENYPADKARGELSLLLAKYWMMREHPERAIFVADQLISTQPDSPFADQLLWLAAQAYDAWKQPERARDYARTLMTDYPGSPLVPSARSKLEEQSKGDPPPPKDTKTDRGKQNSSSDGKSR